MKLLVNVWEAYVSMTPPQLPATMVKSVLMLNAFLSLTHVRELFVMRRRKMHETEPLW